MQYILNSYLFYLKHLQFIHRMQKDKFCKAIIDQAHHYDILAIYTQQEFFMLYWWHLNLAYPLHRVFPFRNELSLHKNECYYQCCYALVDTGSSSPSHLWPYWPCMKVTFHCYPQLLSLLSTKRKEGDSRALCAVLYIYFKMQNTLENPDLHALWQPGHIYNWSSYWFFRRIWFITIFYKTNAYDKEINSDMLTFILHNIQKTAFIHLIQKTNGFSCSWQHPNASAHLENVGQSKLKRL